MLHFGGLLSFAFGGTVLVLVLSEVVREVNSYSSTLSPTISVGGFIGFLFVGYGLFANMKSAKSEAQPKA